MLSKRAMLVALGLIAMLTPLRAGASRFHQDKKDYLSDTEADKIREAINPGDRIKLYVSFADDRLKKLQYELGRTTPEAHRDDILNGLINAYSGCLDDATDEIQDAKDKQMNIHESLKLLESKSKEFLQALQKIEQNGGPGLGGYKDNLEDAIQATQDAISDARDAQKEMLPAPVRRKPS
jgi:hypothetical protein